MVRGIGVGAGGKVGGPGVAPQLGSRMPMDLLGGHGEDRILITHGAQVEKTEEIPEQRMRDKPALCDREMDGQSPSFEAMIDVGGALNLKDQARRELTANVGFE